MKSRYTSIYQKFQLLIEDIQHIMDSNCKGWLNIGNYPFVKIPFANSVNLQWTFRDNQLINLPVALLVKGDSINLRPGQYIFADCELDSAICGKGYYQKTYTIGQIFISDEEIDKLENEVSKDKSSYRVIPMKSCVTAIVTKTPIIDLIDEYLINHSKKDAWSISVPERYIQFSVNALLIFVLAAFVINILLHVLWFVLIGRYHNLQWSATTSGILLIGMPLHLPLLLFICLSNIMWRINFLRYKLDRKFDLTPNTISMESIRSSLSSSISTSESISFTMNQVDNTAKEFVTAHWNQIVNQDYEFAKMIYSMGSLTSLCCVDKKGILADPIATPEKIFIYRKKHKHRSSSLMNLDRTILKTTQEKINSMTISSNSNFDALVSIRLPSIPTEATITSLDLNLQNKGLRIPDIYRNPSFTSKNILPILDINCSLSVPVILDMTRSMIPPFLPSFNDNRWERYLTSLKPIGLNILLNNCNPEVTDRYISFTDNMSVINFKNFNKSQLHHRCVCALATQIGFKSTATERFTLESTFAVCKKNERLYDNNGPSNNSVYSLPAGNVFSTVVKDSVRNNDQLMSQGSADLLMSMCSDYWDGKDIAPLTTYDRSRILEFYNRNIFSSYCIGFSYSPLFNKTKFNNLEDQFILQLLDVKGKTNDLSSKDSHVNKAYRSLLLSRSLFLKNSRSISKITENTNLQSDDINSLLKHQIFLGMISFQADQVQSDVIDCINRLEQACIRFVFFSKDNQLRSRVFAERLGMESGWNCHISLADPDEPDKIFSQNIRRSSSKCFKKFISEEGLKESGIFKRIWSSEPILNAPSSELDQITHSTTLNEKNFYFPPNNEYPEISPVRLSEIENKSIGDSSSLTSISMKSRDSYINNPRDHFREDKSKLPCGIKSIRPHLENVDNVPLQVSLFTDCNPEVDHEMMSIMREYGEVICCCGSALSINNLSLFSSNDCAVAFVPILHKQCWRQHEIKPNDASVLSKSFQSNKNAKISEEEPMLKNKFTVLDQKICFPELSPINIACRLVALPCGLLLHRKTGFNLISFITECHRLIKNALSAVSFYFLSCASFVLLKVLLNLVILIFDYYYDKINKIYLGLDIFPVDSQIIYHFYLHTPVLALVIYFRSTMLGKQLKEPPRKRGRLLTYKQCIRFSVASIGRFLPGILLCIVTLIWNLLILNSYQPIHGSTHNETGENRLIQIVISDYLFIQHNIYIVIISLFYINPENTLWKFNCLKNLTWLIVVTILTSIQFMYFIISWKNQSNSNVYLETFQILHLTIIFSFCGILIVVISGFLSTYWENKALSVEHRLARLYFGTKLGMYSPV